MIKVSAEQITELIVSKTELSADQIGAKIEEKLSQLSGLISKEGAAHIVANELGIKVYQEITSAKSDVKNLLPGMRNIELKAKITQINDIIEFNKNGRQGKVRSMRINDSTGSVRMVLWNDLVDKHTLKEGDVINIKGATVKDNQGYKELHINGSTKIEKIDEEITLDRQRKSIADLKDTDNNIEILATLVQVFDPKFFEICKECGGRAREKDGKYICAKHNETAINYGVALTTTIDDGTSTIRSTFFTNQAARLLGKTALELSEMKESVNNEDIKTSLLGKTYVLAGRVRKNTVLDDIEFLPTLVMEPDLEKEMSAQKVESTSEIPIAKTEAKEEIVAKPDSEEKPNEESKTEEIVLAKPEEKASEEIADAKPKEEIILAKPDVTKEVETTTEVKEKIILAKPDSKETTPELKEEIILAKPDEETKTEDPSIPKVTDVKNSYNIEDEDIVY